MQFCPCQGEGFSNTRQHCEYVKCYDAVLKLLFFQSLSLHDTQVIIESPWASVVGPETIGKNTLTISVKTIVFSQLCIRFTKLDELAEFN